MVPHSHFYHGDSQKTPGIVILKHTLENGLSLKPLKGLE